MTRIYVVIPVLNEAGNLPKLMNSIRDACKEHSDLQFEVVLIDDGSTDNTREVAEAEKGDLSLTVLRHETNQGPGVAFQTAFNWLATRLQDDDWLLTIEGDNTSRLNLLKQMLHRSDEGYEVILASVYMYGGAIVNTNMFRILMSSIANSFVKNLLSIQGLMTISSFYRLYRGGTVRRLQAIYGDGILERSGFECMVEMVMKMVYLGTTISEVPLVLDTSMRVGRSKMKVLKTIRGYLTLATHKNRWKTIAQARQASNLG